MQAEATELIEEGGRVVGLRATTPDGELAIRADLVVGADGRHSTVREQAGFKVDDIGAPMDVLWFRLTHKPSDDAETFGHFEAGRIDDHAQPRRLLAMRLCHSEGRHRAHKGGGPRCLPQAFVAMSPFLADRVDELKAGTTSSF